MLFASTGTTEMEFHLLMVSHLEHSDLLFLTAGEKKWLTAPMNRIKVLSSSNTERETSYSDLTCHLRLKIRCKSVPYVANSREHNPRNQW